jgi:hypothetical protein
MSRHDVWAVSARRRLVSEPVGGLLNRSEILGFKFSFQAKFDELTLPMVKDTWFLSTSSKETKKFRRAMKKFAILERYKVCPRTSHGLIIISPILYPFIISLKVFSCPNELLDVAAIF